MIEMKEKCMKDKVSIKKIDNNDNYEIDRTNFKPEHKIYNINDNNIIQFDEQKTYYAIQDKKSQCNNNIEQWHKWFTITYYYLGNNNGRYNESSNNDITYSIVGGCFNQCIDNYIINEEYKCENKKTFKGGKYKNFFPYDPFAIICLIGSIKYENDKYIINEHVYKNLTEGNYYDTINKLLNDTDDILKDNNMSAKNNIRDLILADINSKTSPDIPSHNILKLINKDILTAHSKIIEYVNYIIKENEKDLDKIEKNIKKDVNKFYNLFDKRDELYIKYLNNFITNKKKLNLLFAKSLALKRDDIIAKIQVYKGDNLFKSVFIYLFEYCSYLCFNKKSIYCERLTLYGTYPHLLHLEYTHFLRNIKTIEATFSSQVSSLGGGKTENTPGVSPLSIIYSGKNDYKPIQVKLETKQFLLFEDYEHILNLYKSFLVVYPVLFTITISIFILFTGLYLIDLRSDTFGTYLVRRTINYLYSWTLWLNYILKWFSYNFILIYIIRSILWLFNSKIVSEKIKEIYQWITSRISITPIIAVILLIIILILIFTVSLKSIFMIIPYTIEFILKMIGYLILFMIGLLIYLSRLDNLLLVCLVIYILYLYFHIIFKFKFSYFADKLLNKKDAESLSTGSVDLLDGKFLIAELINNEDAEQIFFERNKIINYAFLLDTYKYANNILKKL
jgi:hypothetical protein